MGLGERVSNIERYTNLYDGEYWEKDEGGGGREGAGGEREEGRIRRAASYELINSNC